MPPVLTEHASAKINLFLHVTGRRPDDGYHLLDSLVVFASAGDRLTVAADSALSLVLSGPFAAGLEAEQNNLVLRAARALADAAGIVPTGRLTLEKNLPVASGIGGGSADAAAALRLLCRYWDVSVSDAALAAMALKLGADVPVCLVSQPARMSGVGEILKSAPPMPPCGIVLVNPGVAVSTPDVFRARSGVFTPPAALPPAWSNVVEMVATLRDTKNDLQAPAIALCPIVQSVLDALAVGPDCLLARMSGSGATCFGLYPDAISAQAAASAFTHTGWWSWGGALAT